MQHYQVAFRSPVCCENMILVQFFFQVVYFSNKIVNKLLYIYLYVVQDSSVGIATRQEVDFPGIESRLGRGFLHPSSLALGPTQPPTQWVQVFPRCKAAGAWRLPPTPSSAEVKERVAFIACPRMKKIFILRRMYKSTNAL